MKTEKLLYYPIYHPKGSPGSERSDQVRQWVEKFLIPAGIATLNENDANAYLVATGDSGLMKAARDYYDKNKIIVGINCGRLGFLLNAIPDITNIPTQTDELRLIKLNFMQGEFHLKNGDTQKYLAFNDIILGNNIMDFTNFEIKGSLSHFPNRKVQGSGLIVSTPQGTTGYSLRTRGTAAMLDIDVNEWYIGGVATGPYPCDRVSPQTITITIDSRSIINGYADGKSQVVEDISKVIITPSKYKITLGFLVGIDFPAKRTELAQKLERGE